MKKIGILLLLGVLESVSSFTTATPTLTNREIYSPIMGKNVMGVELLQSDVSFLNEARNGQGNLDVSVNTHFDIIKTGNDTIVWTNQKIGIMIPYRMDVFIGSNVPYMGGWFNLESLTGPAFIKNLSLNLHIEGMKSFYDPSFFIFSDKPHLRNSALFVNPTLSTSYESNNTGENALTHNGSYLYTIEEAKTRQGTYWSNLTAWSRDYYNSFQRNGEYVNVESSEVIDYVIYKDETKKEILQDDVAGPTKNKDVNFTDDRDYYFSIYGMMRWTGDDVLPKSLKISTLFDSGLGINNGFRRRFDYDNSYAEYNYNF